MPNLDGLQSTRMIRSMGYAAPIVALTAFAEESNVKECMESGMDMFLAKPIRRPALKQVLKKFATIPEEAEVTSPASRKAVEDSEENVSPGTTPGINESDGLVRPIISQPAPVPTQAIREEKMGESVQHVDEVRE